jgi:chromosome segregation ATPase
MAAIYHLVMAKRDGELSEAAQAFDEALAVYTRLGELFLRTPLDTVKHLERANTTLNELAESEQRLQLTGQLLVAAISSARERQQAISQQVVDRAPALKARNARLGELMTTLQDITAQVGALNEQVVNATANQGELATAMAALAERAEELSRTARGNELVDLADQAHSLHQRLHALAQKLGTAGKN